MGYDESKTGVGAARLRIEIILANDILIFASIFAIARSPVTAVGREDIEIGLTAGTKRKRTALARDDPT